MSRDLSDMFYPHERRDYQVTRDHSKSPWPKRTLVIVIVFALAWAFQALALTDERIGVETAHASAVEEVHQNDYYCERIKSGFYPNIGTGKGITELCSEWGVNLND